MKAGGATAVKNSLLWMLEVIKDAAILAVLLSISDFRLLLYFALTLGLMQGFLLLASLAKRTTQFDKTELALMASVTVFGTFAFLVLAKFKATEIYGLFFGVYFLTALLISFVGIAFRWKRWQPQDKPDSP